MTGLLLITFDLAVDDVGRNESPELSHSLLFLYFQRKHFFEANLPGKTQIFSINYNAE